MGAFLSGASATRAQNAGVHQCHSSAPRELEARAMMEQLASIESFVNLLVCGAEVRWHTSCCADALKRSPIQRIGAARVLVSATHANVSYRTDVQPYSCQQSPSRKSRDETGERQ